MSEEATPKQIAERIGALTTIIQLWSETVANAEQKAADDRKFLADMMAEFVRLSIIVARRAAESLEVNAA